MCSVMMVMVIHAVWNAHECRRNVEVIETAAVGKGTSQYANNQLLEWERKAHLSVLHVNAVVISSTTTATRLSISLACIHVIRTDTTGRGFAYASAGRSAQTVGDHVLSLTTEGHLSAATRVCPSTYAVSCPAQALITKWLLLARPEEFLCYDASCCVTFMSLHNKSLVGPATQVPGVVARRQSPNGEEPSAASVLTTSTSTTRDSWHRSGGRSGHTCSGGSKRGRECWLSWCSSKRPIAIRNSGGGCGMWNRRRNAFATRARVGHDWHRWWRCNALCSEEVSAEHCIFHCVHC